MLESSKEAWSPNSRIWVAVESEIILRMISLNQIPWFGVAVEIKSVYL